MEALSMKEKILKGLSPVVRFCFYVAGLILAIAIIQKYLPSNQNMGILVFGFVIFIVLLVEKPANSPIFLPLAALILVISCLVFIVSLEVDLAYGKEAIGVLGTLAGAIASRLNVPQNS